jgi:ABC-type amino acid transport substrate-binding protein
MWARLTVALVGLLVLHACMPEKPDDDTIPSFAADTVMGEIQEAGVLRIAVEDDRPPWSSFSFVGPESTATMSSGFTVEMGRMIADSLGVDPAFVVATAPEMVDRIEDGIVDVGFPLVPLTEVRVRAHSYSDPYWIGHQRILVTEGSGISGIDDLNGRSLCDVAYEDTGASLADIDADRNDIPRPVLLERPTDPLGCVEPLRGGEVDAVMGPDVLMITYLAELGGGYEIVGEQLTTEGYGPIVRPGKGGFSSFVDSVFAEGDKEGLWRAHYDEWIAPLTGVAMEFPRMTAEGAAALYPSDR